MEALQDNNTYSKLFFLCKHCYDAKKMQKPLFAEGTANAAEHLRRDHSYNSTSKITEPTNSIAHSFELAPYLNKKTHAAKAFINNFIEWVVAEDITFNQASSDRLRNLIAASRPNIARLVPSRNTVRA